MCSHTHTLHAQTLRWRIIVIMHKRYDGEKRKSVMCFTLVDITHFFDIKGNFCGSLQPLSTHIKGAPSDCHEPMPFLCRRAVLSCCSSETARETNLNLRLGMQVVSLAGEIIPTTTINKLTAKFVCLCVLGTSVQLLAF